tara:strand:+ start:910 stop:1146 length:237 start_codon:yes stop_codon:yes gene_type:complete
VCVRRTWDRDGKTSYALTAVSFDFYGLLVARQQLMNFLSRRREAWCGRINPSQGDKAAPAKVPTAKWQRETVGESEVG